MDKIFYADNSVYTSYEALNKCLSDFFGIQNAKILRSKNGKPYLETGPHFSITHTNGRIYIAFSQETVGIDAESLTRRVDFTPIVKKFSDAERSEILSSEDFLRHWTVKESAVKFLGGTLAHDLKKLCFYQNRLTYENAIFPTTVTLLQHEGYILSVCGSERFKNAEFIQLP